MSLATEYETTAEGLVVCRSMASTHPLARRGATLIDDSQIPQYVVENKQRLADADPNDPDRYIGLSVAQNLLMWDVLDAKLNEIRAVQPASVAYDDMTGSVRFREALAAFTSAHVWKRQVAPDNIIALAGLGSVLESLFYVIGNPGDGVLIPTPSYAGYWPDIEVRDELTVVPVQTLAADNYRLTPELLEKAYQESSVPVTSLLLTNPDNPTGQLMSADDLRSAIEWARGHDLHIVVNGIYSLSVRGGEELVSVASVVDSIGTDIHELWSFSKDFAMSGVRCGVLTSNNEDVLNAIREIAYWSAVSGDTQHLLAEMLTDATWSAKFVQVMREHLAASYEATTLALDNAGIPYLNAIAGLFVVVDMRQFLDEATWEAEDRLWYKMLNEANVNITPGSACRMPEPGFFRICFASEPPEVVTQAITRISRILT